MAYKELLQFSNQNEIKQFQTIKPMNSDLFVVNSHDISNRVGRKDNRFLFRNESVKSVDDVKIFEDILTKPGDSKKMEDFKNYCYGKYVIKEKDIPESRFERFARERGDGDSEDTEVKEQRKLTIIQVQKSSLDNWIDYLTSPEIEYPMWAKSWAFHSMLKLSTYNKEKKTFGMRTKGTVAPFPELNRRALAHVMSGVLANGNFSSEKLPGKNYFGRLYAEEVEKISPSGKEELSIIGGQWVTYEKGSDYKELVKSLQGKGTDLCIKADCVAENYLNQGTLYIYFSYDEMLNPTNPRAAIYVKRGKISEVRGIAENQSLDSHIASTDIVEKKLNEFSDKELWIKRTADMKNLTQLEKKQKKGGELTKNELIFLYEVKNKIDGFGYRDDPRIEEIINERNQRQDLALIFNCNPDRVALSHEELNEDTVVLNGSLIAKHYNIEELPAGLVFIRGSLGLRKSLVKELPAKLTSIRRDLDLRKSLVKELPTALTFIGESLYLQDSQLEELPEKLNYIGKLYLQNSNVKLPANVRDIVKRKIYRL